MFALYAMAYASLLRAHLLHARSPLLLRRTAVRMASSVPDISTMTVLQLKAELRKRETTAAGKGKIERVTRRYGVVWGATIVYTVRYGLGPMKPKRLLRALYALRFTCE